VKFDLGGWGRRIQRHFIQVCLTNHSDCKLHAKATLPEKQRCSIPMTCCRGAEISNYPDKGTNKQKATVLKSRKGPPKTTIKKKKRTARYAESHRILEIESPPRAAEMT
jgi:hypothetical protein